MFRFQLTVRSQTIRLLVPVTGIIGLALLITVSGRTGGSTLSKREENRSASSAPDNTSQRREVEVVTLTAGGFEPQQIVRSTGPFLLSVTNRSGADSLSLQLETEQHGRLREKSLPLKTPYWREVVNLPRGQYFITEANHPEWTFSLIIK